MTDFEDVREESLEHTGPEGSGPGDEAESEPPGRTPSLALPLAAALAVGALVALGLAFAVQTSEPRELPFPTFEARAAFPELAEPESEPRETEAAPASAFEARLQGIAAFPEEPSREPRQRRVVPLGGDLVGEIPSDTRSWRWSTEGGATLVVHRAGARPDALVFAEAFAGEIEERPTAEVHRFRVTVDPEGDGGSPFLGALVRALGEDRSSAGRSGDVDRRARIAQILATRTLGRGLGFAAGEQGHTGWRWVGRNEHRVALRLARWEGTWREQRPLPAELAAALPEGSADDPGGPSAQPLTRVPAYLLLGSAADPTETSGAHLAILCARTPDCPVAEELAAFLTSLRVEPPDLLDRLLGEAPEPFRELAASAGLEIREPTDDEEEEGVGGAGAAGHDTGSEPGMEPQGPGL